MNAGYTHLSPAGHSLPCGTAPRVSALKLLNLHPGVQLRRTGSDAVGEGSEF